MVRKGNLFIISGPSGAGKGTLVYCILENIPDAWLSISATTRNPRVGEQNGKQYYFLTTSDFEDRIAQNGFLEWAQYSGCYYGTPKESVEEAISQGKQVILEIDVQGALQIKKLMPHARLIFIEPPSFDELKRRLVQRGTEDVEAIKRRLETAKVEISQKNEYDIQLVNDNLDKACQELVNYINLNAEETRG